MNATDNNNITEVTSQHEQYNTEVHPVILTLCLAIVVWLLFANTVIVVCFITNRKKVWPLFVAQIFCLSLSDLFVGLVLVPYIILPIAKHDHVAVSYLWCSTIFYLLVCSQCGSLYHMLAICAHRCLRIQMSTTIVDPQRNRKIPFCLALLSWIVSFVVCAIPFVFWADTERTMYSCVMQEVFVDIKKVMGLFTIILFLPQALTNVLYAVACLRLRCIWRRVFPNSSVSSPGQTNSTSIAPSGYNRTNIRFQRRFMGTIGIIMLLFNICTLPVICLALLENKYHVTNRNFRYTACTAFVINSALNPFIYAYRSSWLKNALKQLIRNMSDCFV